MIKNLNHYSAVLMLSKLTSIFFGFVFLFFLGGHNSSEGKEYLSVFFAFTFFSIFESQVFYIVKNQWFSNLKLLIILSFSTVALVFFICLSSSDNLQMKDLVIVAFLAGFRCLFIVFEIKYELKGYNKFVHLSRYLSSSLAFLFSFIFVIYYHLSNLYGVYLYIFLLVFFGVFFIFKILPKVNKEGRDLFLNVKKSISKFQFKILFSTICGYLGGQYFLLSLGDEYIKSISLLFMISNAIVAVFASVILVDRGDDLSGKKPLAMCFFLIMIFYILFYLYFEYLPFSFGFVIEYHAFFSSFVGVSSIFVFFIITVLQLLVINILTDIRRKSLEGVFFSNWLIVFVVFFAKLGFFSNSLVFYLFFMVFIWVTIYTEALIFEKAITL